LKKYPLLSYLIIFLLPALACNFPGGSTTAGLSAEDLHQTLAAQSTATSLGTSPSGGTPPTNDQILPAITPGSPTQPSIPETTQAPYPQGSGELYAYATRSGDTLPALAGRFGVQLVHISSPPGTSELGLLPIGLTLYIPALLERVTPGQPLLPDDELVYSPTAFGFDINSFIQTAGGYLGDYQEEVDDETLTGSAIIQRVAEDLSVNPRLLLAILEQRAGWVYGQPTALQDRAHPLELYIPDRPGLYQEIQIAATQLNLAYYGWRAGTFTQIEYRQGPKVRLNPTLNAGSAAIQHLYAIFYRQSECQEALSGPDGFLALYQRMFGDPWERAAAVGPLFPLRLEQPVLELPFAPGERWSLTAGPHNAWNAGTPRAALDLSPVTGEAVCAVSSRWVLAAAPGVVVRADRNAVILDLDGDGYEGTGWVLLYFHLAEHELVQAGTVVALDEPLGHPSCEGGRSTGKHVHIARKYNGEWIPANEVLPFVVSGWRAVADATNYQGQLVKGDQVVQSNSGGSRTSIIVR